jgi:hypothetical protein
MKMNVLFIDRPSGVFPEEYRIAKQGDGDFADNACSRNSLQEELSETR